MGTGHPALFFIRMQTASPHWVHEPPPGLLLGRTIPLDFRFQHIHPVSKCSVQLQPSGGLLVKLEQPMRAITPGQYAVFYDGHECLGSAQIVDNRPSLYDLNMKQHVTMAKDFT